MRRTALRAGLAAGLVVVAVIATPGPRTLAQETKPAPSDTNAPAASPQPSAPAASPTEPGAPSMKEPPPQPQPAQPPPSPPAGAPSTANPPASPPAAGAPPAEPQAGQASPPPAAPNAAPTPPPEPAAPSTNPAPSQPPAPPSNPAAKPPPPPPPTKSVLDKHFILGILGKEVKSAKGEDMGRIVDVIVDWTGQTRAAIIDFGGFLGVGSRRIAVDWSALHFEPQQKGDQITLDLTREQLKNAPEYKEGQPVVVLGPSGKTETMPYY